MFHILIQGIKHWYVLDVRSWTDEDVQQPCLYEPLSIQVSILICIICGSNLVSEQYFLMWSVESFSLCYVEVHAQEVCEQLAVSDYNENIVTRQQK